MAARMFEQGEFRRVSERESQEAFDRLSDPLGASFHVHEVGDVVDALPGTASRSRLLALRQRAMDTRSIWLPISDEIREQRLERQRADVRLKQLTLARGQGGPGLTDSDDQVVDIKRKLARLDGEIARLTTLEKSRGATMHNAGALLRDLEAWLRRGRPPGTQLIDAAPIEINDALKKDERLVDGVERLRHRLRELDADAHRVRSAPFPSGDAKKRLKDQIENLAMRGVPDVSALIEHNADIGWPLTMQRLPLTAMGEKGMEITGNAQGEVHDVLALFCWLNRAALVKALDGLIDSEADDGNALSVTDRELRLSEIATDRLMVERQESALIWSALSAGDNIEHRADASPQAVLGVELRTG
jgi:hypothetical protein